LDDREQHVESVQRRHKVILKEATQLILPSFKAAVGLLSLGVARVTQ
jgi:hypothetical protein